MSSRWSGPGKATPPGGQFADIPGVDSLYFTMPNHNKRSITLHTRHPKGKDVLDKLIEYCDA